MHLPSKKKSEEALKVANSGGLTETEKKEKKALEKKLCEMEEELKVSWFLEIVLLSFVLHDFCLSLSPPPHNEYRGLQPRPCKEQDN